MNKYIFFVTIILSFLLNGCAIIDDIRRGGADEGYSSATSDLEFDRERRIIKSQRPVRTKNLGSNYIVPDPALQTARDNHRRNNYQLGSRKSESFEKRAIETRDIFLGMTSQAVKASWGEPKAIESAGDPRYGYQRWKYETFIPSAEGYVKESRVVYFEQHKVVGWETY